MQLRVTLGRGDLERACGTCRLPGTAVDSPDLTSFDSVVAISHLCSHCRACAIAHVPGPGFPTGMLPEVGPSDQVFRRSSATCIKRLWIRQKWVQPDRSWYVVHVDPPTPEVLSMSFPVVLISTALVVLTSIGLSGF